MPGTLYLVPNLLGLVPPAQVLPAHTIAVARGLRHFIVETARPARQFLKTLALDVAIADLHIAELPQTASTASCAALLQPAHDGAHIGLVSDAGCPGIADPGAALVAAAHRAQVRVVPLVGPCSLVLGLMASGMNGQSFTFHGYLPVAHDARAAALRRLDEDVARTGATQLFIETPYRNEALLQAIVATCRPTTQCCVAADLTLPTEWIRSAPVSTWRHGTPEIGRRPALFLLGRDAAPEATAPRRRASS